jgi:cytochrome c biogenesis protein CcdA
MLMLGLVTSLHCVSMCGPMVVSYALKGSENGTLAQRAVPNLAYQAAKLTSYVIVGVVLGALGSAFNIDGIRPYIMFVAGGFMIILGLGMTGKVPWAARLTPRPPKFLMQALVKTRRKASADAEMGVRPPARRSRSVYSQVSCRVRRSWARNSRPPVAEAHYSAARRCSRSASAPRRSCSRSAPRRV